MQGLVLNSAYQYGQSRDNVLYVLGVELRDNVLKNLQCLGELP